MIVPVSKENEKEWIDLCLALWPDTSEAELIDGYSKYKLQDFLYYASNLAIAFISLSIRHEYVFGTETSPVGYVEGIYVAPEHRKAGIGKALINYAKEWAFSQGCNELASDVELNNEESQIFHENMGFSEVPRFISYTMNLLRTKEKKHGMDPKSPEFKAAMSAVRERIALIKRRETRGGFIDYYGCRNICHELQSIIEETIKFLNRGHYVYAYSVAILVQINLAKLASRADSAGGITDTRYYVDNLLGEICTGLEAGSPDAKFIYLQSTKDSLNKVFDGWSEFAYDVLENTALLAEEASKQKMLSTLDNIRAKSGNAYSHWYLGREAVVKLQTVKAVGGNVDKFIAENLEHDVVRKIAIEKAIADGNFDIAEKLCLDKITDDTPRHEWSRPSEWRYLLFEIYTKENNVKKKIEAAQDLLFRFDIEYYDVLKALLTEQKVWEQEYQGLLTAFSNTLPLYMYMEILSKENELEKLLEAVRVDTSSIFMYGKQLSAEFGSEVYSICISEIYELVDDATDRKKYKKICKHIKSLFDYGGISAAEEIIVDLIEKFPRRTAFVDELESLSQKLDKAKIKMANKKL